MCVFRFFHNLRKHVFTDSPAFGIKEQNINVQECSGRSDRGVWGDLRERGKIKEEERERERVPSLSLHITSHHVTSRSHSTSLLTSPHPLIFFPAHVFLPRHHNLNAWNRPSDQKPASHSWIKKNNKQIAMPYSEVQSSRQESNPGVTIPPATQARLSRAY